MWVLAAVLVRLCLGASGSDYRLWYNYNVQVYDWQGNHYHGQKPMQGSITAVNTPYGLYLSGQTVVLPPNSQSSSTFMRDLTNFRVQVFMRLLPGVAGTVPREIISLKDGSNTQLQLRQQSASEASSPTFELEYRVGGTTYTDTVTGSYALSKPYLGKWYIFQIIVKQNGSYSDVKLCINAAETISTTKTGHFNYDWTSNYLGGVNTRGIYYRFIYDGDTEGSDCSSDVYTTVYDSSCSYVCPNSYTLICDTDAFTFDYECKDCSTSCGNYGCMQHSPVSCWTDSCPPSDQTDQACEDCYPRSRENSNWETMQPMSCSCDDKHYYRNYYPPSCYRKYKSACLDERVETVASYHYQCPYCFDHSTNNLSTCQCKSEYAEQSRTETTLECFSTG
jgi:hypothetical protein